MATWAYLSRFLGIYTSPVFNIDLDGDGSLSRISWEGDVPDGTKLTIQTSVSYDLGITWEDWLTATNDGSIPHITTDMDLHNLRFKYRALFETLDVNLTPSLNKIEFRLEPIINFMNEGDKEILPEVFIKKVGNGNLSIINISNGNNETSLTGLVDQEELYLNGEREQVETSFPMVYRYSNFNDNHLVFVVGDNVLKVEGDADITFKYELKYLHGF